MIRANSKVRRSFDFGAGDDRAGIPFREWLGIESGRLPLDVFVLSIGSRIIFQFGFERHLAFVENDRQFLSKRLPDSLVGRQRNGMVGSSCRLWHGITFAPTRAPRTELGTSHGVSGYYPCRGTTTRARSGGDHGRRPSRGPGATVAVATTLKAPRGADTNCPRATSTFFGIFQPPEMT